MTSKNFEKKIATICWWFGFFMILSFLYTPFRFKIFFGKSCDRKNFSHNYIFSFSHIFFFYNIGIEQKFYITHKKMCISRRFKTHARWKKSFLQTLIRIIVFLTYTQTKISCTLCCGKIHKVFFFFFAKLFPTYMWERKKNFFPSTHDIRTHTFG